MAHSRYMICLIFIISLLSVLNVQVFIVSLSPLNVHVFIESLSVCNLHVLSNKWIDILHYFNLTFLSILLIVVFYIPVIRMFCMCL